MLKNTQPWKILLWPLGIELFTLLLLLMYPSLKLYSLLAAFVIVVLIALIGRYVLPGSKK
jgi:hypothetical protein